MPSPKIATALLQMLRATWNYPVDSSAYALYLRVSNEKLAEANRTRDLQEKNDELEQALHELGEAQEQARSGLIYSR